MARVDLIPTAQRSGGRRLQVDEHRDFTGGLNFRKDVFQLADNETPDCLNVDFDQRGGVRLRGGTEFWGTQKFVNGIRMLMAYETSAFKRLISADGNNTWYSDGTADWTLIQAHPITGAETVNGVVYNNLLFVQRPISQVLRWDGTTATTLGVAWSEDIAAPTSGNMPIAKHITTHLGSVWVANIITDQLTLNNEPSRVRWSHPGRAQAWRSKDYIDIDVGERSDEITGLTSFGDALIVFKRKAVYAIFGVFPDFQVVTLGKGIGSVGHHSWCKGDDGVYFFSWPDGVFKTDGKAVDYLWDRMASLIAKDGFLLDAFADKISLGWGHRRLYVNVPHSADQTRWSTLPTEGVSRTYVYDPTLTKQGSWTQYQWGQAPGQDTASYKLCPYKILEWTPQNLNQIVVALATSGYSIKLDRRSIVTDSFGPTTLSGLHIQSYYTTSWHAQDGPVYKKRFKRLELVVYAGASIQLEVEVYKDYDSKNPVKTFNVAVSPPSGALVWGTGTWGTGTWSGSGNVDVLSYERGAVLGNARAVQIKVWGPRKKTAAASVSSQQWAIDALIEKFYVRKLR